MISALCNTADWNNGRTLNTNQQIERNTTRFKGKSIVSVLLSFLLKVQNIIYSIHYSAWYKIQLHSSHLNLQKRFLYLRLRFEHLHFNIHATTFLYTVLLNILQNVTLNYFQHFQQFWPLGAIGHCFFFFQDWHHPLIFCNSVFCLKSSHDSNIERLLAMCTMWWKSVHHNPILSCKHCM